jgi:hypothetical protein
MLNPSTADATLDDPTIRRCIGFSKAWGRNALTVCNLYALRATDPADLWKSDDPIGPENDLHLLNSFGDLIVCAWGANAKLARVEHVCRLLNGSAPLMCLGTTNAGAPRHPLYIAGATPLQTYSSSRR